MASTYPTMVSHNTAYDIIAAQCASRIRSNNVNGYCTPSSLWSCPPSPTSSIDTNKAGDSNDEAGHSPAGSSEISDVKPTQKDRRANRYKNCSEAVLSKRRAQNRANQRAYRKRKEQRLEELQAQIDEMYQKNDALCSAYRLLANECFRLRASQLPEQQQQSSPPTTTTTPPTTTWDLNGAGNMVLDVAALNAFRPAPLANPSPMPESYMDYPGTPDKMWNPYP